jgi:hypothetical protein
MWCRPDEVCLLAKMNGRNIEPDNSRPEAGQRGSRNRWLTGRWRLTYRPSVRSGGGEALRCFVQLFVGILVSLT